MPATDWRPTVADGRARTIRFRITAIATVAVVAVLVVTGLALVVAQRRQLTTTIDDGLRQRADDLSALITSAAVPPTLAGDAEDWAQIVTADGSVLAATTAIGSVGPVADAMNTGAPERIVTVPEAAGDDDSFRILSRAVEGAIGTVTLHVGMNMEEVAESTAALSTSLMVAIPVTAVLLAGMVWWLVGRTLSPIEAMRAQAAAIGGSAVGGQITPPGTGDEVDRLGRTLNDMLVRIRESTARQQRFVADASHELRSPLTRIRSEVEVDLRHPESADVTATLQSILEEVSHMELLVEDLLHLARSDAGAVTMRREPVDLDDLVLQDADRLRAMTDAEIDLGGVSAAQVLGDPTQLARALGNLTDNAVAHASKVWVTVQERNGEATVTVTDDGPGIPAEDRERVFERFARLDEARTTETGGTGLGLAITKEIIDRHGGTIRVDADPDGGARFVVTLPLPAG